MDKEIIDSNNMMNARDCLQRAWNNTIELVRDFEMYSKSIDGGEVSEAFKKMAEEQGVMANNLRELYNQYDNNKK